MQIGKVPQLLLEKNDKWGKVYNSYIKRRHCGRDGSDGVYIWNDRLGGVCSTTALKKNAERKGNFGLGQQRRVTVLKHSVTTLVK